MVGAIRRGGDDLGMGVSEVGWISVEAAVLLEMLRVLEDRGDTAGIAALMSYLVDGASPAGQPPRRPWDIATVSPETPPTIT